MHSMLVVSNAFMHCKSHTHAWCNNVHAVFDTWRYESESMSERYIVQHVEVALEDVKQAIEGRGHVRDHYFQIHLIV